MRCGNWRAEFVLFTVKKRSNGRLRFSYINGKERTTGC
jgi:hypothetical protein